MRDGRCQIRSEWSLQDIVQVDERDPANPKTTKFSEQKGRPWTIEFTKWVMKENPNFWQKHQYRENQGQHYEDVVHDPAWDDYDSVPPQTYPKASNSSRAGNPYGLDLDQLKKPTPSSASANNPYGLDLAKRSKKYASTSTPTPVKAPTQNQVSEPIRKPAPLKEQIPAPDPNLDPESEWFIQGVSLGVKLGRAQAQESSGPFEEIDMKALLKEGLDELRGIENSSNEPSSNSDSSRKARRTSTKTRTKISTERLSEVEKAKHELKRHLLEGYGAISPDQMSRKRKAGEELKEDEEDMQNE